MVIELMRRRSQRRTDGLRGVLRREQRLSGSGGPVARRKVRDSGRGDRGVPADGDADLDEVQEPGMSGSAVLIRWQMWGRDPFIRADEGEQAPEWSAWKYAATRTKTL